MAGNVQCAGLWCPECLHDIIQITNMQHIGNLLEFPVERPEEKPGQHGRRKEVNIHVAQPLPHEIVALNEREHFFVLHCSLHREGFQK